ncbi:MAG: hypothetical protein M3R35_01690 [Candidatus Eremiobacteraeota bacterium]|nr:hypothetical protein [Candidatus Eremiobacteraeota bacterium]
MTSVFAKRDVDCPFSATIEMIQRLGEKSSGHAVGPFSKVLARVELELSEVRDYTDQTRSHEALSIRWKARARIPVPMMRGLVTVRPNSLMTELRMEGTYEPPFGVFGRLFDRLLGRRLALRTVERFLVDLRNVIEREWQVERRAYELEPKPDDKVD